MFGTDLQIRSDSRMPFRAQFGIGPSEIGPLTGLLLGSEIRDTTPTLQSVSECLFGNIDLGSQEEPLWEYQTLIKLL